jgi:hypothetical protein
MNYYWWSVLVDMEFGTHGLVLLDLMKMEVIVGEWTRKSKYEFVCLATFA